MVSYRIFDKMFASPPKVVLRDGKRGLHLRKSDRGHASTVHFYFPDGEGGDSGKENEEKSRSSAFCRVLLHTVCQFHGLDTSSSVVSSGGRSKHGAASQGGIKAVTVQGGAMLAPKLRLLDYVE